ncbi:hypothetical protein [Shinella zoogloeoides]|uniref:hypothetical protein n=1 Tax=Shinella zoogloeoides TaxID=352475 RepID=UPI00273D7F1F|nr:hypothetical protein [Shinella zoogloeoides]WLR95092.1 hypothetical protein Q9316_20695 [Shinella zoogloeoides]
MEKEAEIRKSKDNSGRDSTKPGTIVAGPEAHARERKGADPSAKSTKPKDEPAGKPANRS